MSTILDAQIAADMALAAMDNRASYATLTIRQRRIALLFADERVQRRNRVTGWPLHLAARATYQTGHPVWIEED